MIFIKKDCFFFKDYQLRDINKAKPKTYNDKLFITCPLYFSAFDNEPLKGFFCEKLEKENINF